MLAVFVRCLLVVELWVCRELRDRVSTEAKVEVESGDRTHLLAWGPSKVELVVVVRRNVRGR